MPKVYSFNPETGEFIGESRAHIDPVESEMKGELIWLLPANSTYEPPPDIKEGDTCIWDWEAGSWKIVENNRGMVYRKSDAKQFFHKSITEPIPEGFTKKAPSCEYPMWSEQEGAWVVDEKSKADDERKQLIQKEMMILLEEMAIQSLIKKGLITG